MGLILMYSIIILFFLLCLSIGLFIFSRRNKSITGQIVSLFIFLIVMLLLSTNTIDELSISKKDVTSDLNQLNIKLKDDFEIINNKVTGMPERIQETKIKISQKDKYKIINEIRNSTNFKSLINEQDFLKNSGIESVESKNTIHNFKYPEFYSRETHVEINKIPKLFYLSIYDDDAIIKYQIIED